MRYGVQVDIQGLIAGGRADKRVGYLTKYLTKDLSDDLDDDTDADAARRTHIDRLHEEVRWLPCSPSCSNWLRFGVQPKDAEPGMEPGMCPRR